MIKEFKITSFYEFIDTIKAIKEDNKDDKIWYRGQSKSDYRLTPGIFRNVFSVADKFYNKVDVPKKANIFSNNGDYVVMPNMSHLFHRFKECVDLSLFNIENDVQILEIAQHHGLPTLLLDWTTDPMIALFFAIGKIKLECIYETSDQHASVWLINPLKINKITFNDENIRRIINSVDDYEMILQESRMLNGTFCFEGTKSHPRICRQSGNFTFTCPGIVWTLDFNSIYEDCIYKIDIPYSAAISMQEILKLFDISDKTIFFGESIVDDSSHKIKEKELNDFFRQLYIL